MSSPQPDYALRLMAEQRIEEYLREAEMEHRMREVHPRGSSWLTRAAWRPLRRFRHALERLGRGLQNGGVPNPRPTQ